MDSYPAILYLFNVLLCQWWHVLVSVRLLFSHIKSKPDYERKVKKFSMAAGLSMINGHHHTFDGQMHCAYDVRLILQMQSSVSELRDRNSVEYDRIIHKDSHGVPRHYIGYWYSPLVFRVAVSKKSISANYQIQFLIRDVRFPSSQI